ncbi:MAG: 3-oxoacyl-[acyl-carrier-protein] reductase [Phycisphaerales bacterium]
MSEKRVAIVTGASRGIGRAIAERLAADGHHVVLMSRSEGPLNDLRASIEAAGGEASVHACDVGDAAALADAIGSVAKERGRIDILVNNAGITRDGLILRMTEEDFDDVIRVNLKSTFVAMKAAARPMMSNRYGRVVNIGSISGLGGRPGQANYAAAKAGLVGMTKSAAKELGAKGITFNVVAPGFIETDMTSSLPDGVKNEALGATPIRRFGQPEDVAAMVSFLASEQAGFITGQVIAVDGGMAM